MTSSAPSPQAPPAAAAPAVTPPAAPPAPSGAGAESPGSGPAGPPAVRPLTLADLTACCDLAESRGWARDEHKWRLLLTAGQGYGLDAPPGDPVGGLIGTCVTTTYPGTGAGPGGRTSYACLSMVLVAPHHARRGLATRLLEHALAACGDSVPFLTATEAGRPLYERFGFRSVGRITTLRGRFAAAPGDAPAPAAWPGAAVRPATAADLPSVLALDAEVFGADRTGLLARLPSFADHFLVAESPAAGSRPPRGGRAGNGTLTGFAAAWPGTGETVIGPVVADDPDTGHALVAGLAARAPGTVRFDADDRHAALAGWLRARGLDGDTSCVLMVRGAPDLPGDATRRFAPYSVALG